MLVVDDQPDVHVATRLALADFVAAGCGPWLLEARSAARARQVRQAEPHCAVVLLEVVMEIDDAGLAPARSEACARARAGVTAAAASTAPPAMRSSARRRHSCARSREQETLLKVRHRAKDNPHLVSSLLRLLGEKTPSPQARGLPEESVLRVQSMALVHQHL